MTTALVITVFTFFSLVLLYGLVRFAKGEGQGVGRVPVPGRAGHRPAAHVLPAGVAVVPPTCLQQPLLAMGTRRTVVGESFYQDALLTAASSKTDEGTAVRVVTAQLLLENDNPFDNQAVGVYVGGRRVGHIPRGETPVYRRELALLGIASASYTCRAWLTGGWDRGDRGSGTIGVQLDIASPLRLFRPSDPLLPPGNSVNVVGEKAFQGHLADVAKRGSGPLIATLVEGNQAGKQIVEVWIGGGRVGSLSSPSTAKYLPIIRTLVTAGLPTTCEAAVTRGNGGWEVEVSLLQPGALGSLYAWAA